MTSLYRQHVERWKDCAACPLFLRRNRVVLARGKIPCDVLFIGEAPGMSEDALGQPFVGPAGKLLDRMIADAGGASYRIAFTNLVACIPLGEDGEKVTDPPKESVDACQDRLREFAWLAKPKIVVLVGKHSQKTIVGQADFSLTENGRRADPPDWLWLGEGNWLELVPIIHPAAILRMDISQRGLTIQQTILKLENAFDSQVPF